MEQFLNVSPSSGFTQISNKMVIRNRELSLQERAILCILLSNEPGYHVCLDSISKLACISKNTASKYIRNLEKKNFIYKERKRDKNGIPSIVNYYYSWDQDQIIKLKETLKPTLKFDAKPKKEDVNNLNLIVDNSSIIVNKLSNNADKQTPVIPKIGITEKHIDNQRNPKNCDYDKSLAGSGIPGNPKNWEVKENTIRKDQLTNTTNNNINNLLNNVDKWVREIDFDSMDKQIRDFIDHLIKSGFNYDSAIILMHKGAKLETKYKKAYSRMIDIGIDKNIAVKLICLEPLSKVWFNWVYECRNRSGKYNFDSMDNDFKKHSFLKRLNELNINL